MLNTMDVSVRAAAAGIIAADFYAAPTDSLLQLKIQQRLPAARQRSDSRLTRCFSRWRRPCKAHLTNLRIWAIAQRIWPIGQTCGIRPNAQRLVNCAHIWPIARCTFGQLRCAFGQANYFQNKTTYARPLFIKRNLKENVYQVVAVNALKF